MTKREFRLRETVQESDRKAVRDVLALKGVNKWFLPGGQKQIMLWLNKDPLQAKQAEIEAIKQKSGMK